MPGPLNDTYVRSANSSHLISGPSNLPSHHTQNRHLEAQDAHSTELENLNQQHKLLTPDDFELSSEEDLDLDSTEEDGLTAEERLPSQMKRSSKKAKRTSSNSPGPGLRIKTSKDGDLNGHANGSMNSNIEHRRKHVSNEDTVRAQMMAREDFSLDNEPAPPTPRTPGLVSTSYTDLPPADKRNFLLLVLLYFLQGIPLGLAGGSIAFLLKKYLSYSQIGVFSLSIYPYSLKLLWSPIVDAVWSRRVGRRKSWILPIQTISGFSMIYLSSRIDEMMVAAGKDNGAGVWGFTGWWFLLVFFCATQDIAVDGWAISILSMQNISYASTAQTVGLTGGSFLSHTVFLALNAPDFANKWFRSTPQDTGLITLGGYMHFWGWMYLLVTLGLAIFKKEEKNKDREGILDVYKSMWSVLKLKNIITIITIHLIVKIGFVTNEAVTNLKLLDKGFGQANLALVVLIDFPFEMGLGYYAGKWSTEYTPLRLWCWAIVARLGAAIVAQITVMIYPVVETEAVPTWYLLSVIISHIYSTFTSTIMFVAVAAFHARIADPSIGGTYMTLLATVSNLGGTFPKFFVLKLVDYFTKATCIPPTTPIKLAEGIIPVTSPFSCVAESARDMCKKGGGTCHIERDGYYITNVICVIIGAILFWTYIEKKALALQALPLRAWRVGGDQIYSRVSGG